MERVVTREYFFRSALDSSSFHHVLALRSLSGTDALRRTDRVVRPLASTRDSLRTIQRPPSPRRSNSKACAWPTPSATSSTRFGKIGPARAPPPSTCTNCASPVSPVFSLLVRKLNGLGRRTRVGETPKAEGLVTRVSGPCCGPQVHLDRSARAVPASSRTTRDDGQRRAPSVETAS